MYKWELLQKKMELKREERALELLNNAAWLLDNGYIFIPQDFIKRARELAR